MKTMQLILLVAMNLAVGLNPAFADSAEDAWSNLVGKKITKHPEFAFVKGDPELPNILIYGDSISIGYTQRVRENLKGKANVYRIHCNGADTASVIPVMKQMYDAMGEHWSFKWDVIHFNSGLHDLKYLDENKRYNTNTGTQVRSPEEYVKQLKDIFAYFKQLAPKSKVIFATTTPVPEQSRGRKAGDASKFNDAALGMLKDYPEVAINDLYALTKANHAKWWTKPGNVHYNKTGSNAQGDEVARVILKALSGYAATSATIQLWPDAVPGESAPKAPPVISEINKGNVTRIKHVTDPRLIVYKANREHANGAAVIVCPGGGYGILAIDKEGYEIAEWLSELGYTAFVLQYRVPNNQKGALQDAQRAIRLVRASSEEYGLDPTKIGFLGFSAGGSLSARISTRYLETLYEPIDERDDLSARPDFAVLVYPAYLDLGEHHSLTPELKVDAETPPMFMFVTADDKYARSSLVMSASLRKNNVPVELHMLPKGGHGYGMRSGGRAAKTWPKLCQIWLELTVLK